MAKITGVRVKQEGQFTEEIPFLGADSEVIISEEQPDATSKIWINPNEELGESPDTSGLADVAWSGSYNDLVDKPELSRVAETGSYNDLIDKPNVTENLATVATSGDYNDLIGRPDLKTVATTGSYDDLENIPTTLVNSTAIKKIEVVTVLPEQQEEGTLYIVEEE